MGLDRSSRRRFLQTSGIVTTTALTGATPAMAVGGGSSNRPTFKSLDLALAGEPETLDPMTTAQVGAPGVVTEQLFDGLTTYPDGEPRAQLALARKIEYLDDYQRVRVHLEPGARFHGGYGQVTADDVVYSFERSAQNAYHDRVWRMLDRTRIELQRDDNGEYVPGTLGVEAVDDQTVDFHLREPFYGLPEIFAFDGFSIIPEGIVDDVEGYEGEMSASTFAASPIGTGPFELDDWSEDDITITPFEDYYGKRPWVSDANWEFLPGEETLDAAGAGTLDMWGLSDDEFDPSRRTIERSQAYGTVSGTYDLPDSDLTANFRSVPSQSIFYAGFNCENVPKPVREAVALIVNQRDIVDQIYDGALQPAAHFTPPTLYPGGVDAYQDHSQAYPHGLDETRVDAARAVMEDAEYGPDNRYSLEWRTFNSPTQRELATYLEERLAKAHIDLQFPEPTEDSWKEAGYNFAHLLHAIRNEMVDAFYLGWITDWPGAENVLQLLYPPRSDTDTPDHRVSGFDWDGTGPAAQRATDAFDRVLAHQKPTREHRQIRAKAFVEMEEANWDGVAAVPMFHGRVRRFWHDWVHHDEFGSMGPQNQKFTDVKLRPKRSASGKGNGR